LREPKGAAPAEADTGSRAASGEAERAPYCDASGGTAPCRGDRNNRGVPEGPPEGDMSQMILMEDASFLQIVMELDTICQAICMYLLLHYALILGKAKVPILLVLQEVATHRLHDVVVLHIPLVHTLVLLLRLPDVLFLLFLMQAEWEAL
ncbi:hypothetical protein Taro_045610, partial [Colocasia esculenta]|nr:hypothetical protein [Colocasia esculenta]